MVTIARDSDGVVHRIVKKAPFKEADCGAKPEGPKRTQFSDQMPINGCDECDWGTNE